MYGTKYSYIPRYIFHTYEKRKSCQLRERKQKILASMEKFSIVENLHARRAEDLLRRLEIAQSCLRMLLVYLLRLTVSRV